MADTDKLFSNIYQKLNDWLVDINKHELTTLIELVEQAKAYAYAAESLSEERIKQFITNFNYDLKEFTHELEQDSSHSIYLALLKERWWQTLADMADKTQIEWAELPDDFAHDGVYQAGDFIGFGQLSCCQCQTTLTVSHFSEVAPCRHCGYEHFHRIPLSP